MTTHERWAIPPRSPTIVGSAVETIVSSSAATASRAVDALETLGLITRAPEAADRRALSIELTPEGRELLDGRLRRAADAFEPAIAALSAAERRTLLALLERMTTALRAGPTRSSGK